MARLTLIVSVADEGKPVRAVARQRLSMSYGQFKRAKFQGALLLDGTPVHADRPVKTGQTLVVEVPEPQTAPIMPAALALTVAYEDDDLLIVDKPAPLPSVPSPKQSGVTLANMVVAYLGEPDNFTYHPVNRLDKGTSGLMAIAKHAHAQQYLQRQLHTDAYIREYLAVCDGCPPQPEGEIDAPIRKEDGASIRRILAADGKSARTVYRVEQTGGSRSLLRLRLATGRTHQIRVHLASIGCPVTGDFLYGREHTLLVRRFALHSASLALVTPQNKSIRLESSMPDVLAALLVSQP